MPTEYSSEQILKSNMALFDGRMMREAEKRLPMLGEVAAFCADMFALRREEGILSFLPRLKTCLSAPTLDSDLFDGQEHLLTAFGQMTSALDRVALLTAFRDACATRGILLDHTPFFPAEEHPHHRIAYVRNVYTDEAYGIFSAEDSEATLLYADGFREACEAVTEGRADFCILPFENSSGPLTSFTDMAARHALVLVALCRVFHADGTDATRFALLAKDVLASGGGSNPCIRLCFTVENGAVLAEHITAFSAVAGNLLAVGATPDTAGENALLCTLTLRCPREHAFLPLAYLYTFTDFPRLLGFYEEKEE